MSNEQIKNILDKAFTKTNKINPHFIKRCSEQDIEIITSYTNFLDEDCSVAERLFCLKQGINYQTTCHHCNKSVRYDTKRKKYPLFCSVQCANQSELKKQQILKTQQKKYGGNPAQNETIKQKRKQTNIKKYGVETPLLNDEIKAKTQKTMKDKYGVYYALQAQEIKDKWVETNIKKYNAKYPLESKIIQEKIIQTNIRKYGVPYIISSDFIRKKITGTIKQKYNCNHISQKNIPPAVLSILKNPTLLKIKHHEEKKSLSEIASELNVNVTTVYNYFKQHKISINNFFESKQQKNIQDFLSQYIEIIPNYTLENSRLQIDIFIPSLKLGIEFCGLFWHCDYHSRIDKNYHLRKLEECNKRQIRLITIFEDEWNNKQDIISSMLLHLINKNPKQSIGARECKVIYVEKNKKANFFKTNHILGDGRSSYNIGLIDKNNCLVACLGALITQKEIIINRFATSRPVIGGFSKLLTTLKKDFLTVNKPIVTFADRRFSEGNLYIKTGFKLDYIIKPDYYYVYKGKRYHKFNFRHKHLQKILYKYDADLSETINCRNNGIYKIWNCGLLKFKLESSICQK